MGIYYREGSKNLYPFIHFDYHIEGVEGGMEEGNGIMYGYWVWIGTGMDGVVGGVL